jgi:tRNA-specific 2-thiouridylase
MTIGARVRSTRAPAPARLLPGGEIEFEEPEIGVSPGQACVFYESCEPQARVLGGGFIVAASQ